MLPSSGCIEDCRCPLVYFLDGWRSTGAVYNSVRDQLEDGENVHKSYILHTYIRTG